MYSPYISGEGLQYSTNTRGVEKSWRKEWVQEKFVTIIREIYKQAKRKVAAAAAKLETDAIVKQHQGLALSPFCFSVAIGVLTEQFKAVPRSILQSILNIKKSHLQPKMLLHHEFR